MAHPNFNPENSWIRINQAPKILKKNLPSELRELPLPSVYEREDESWKARGRDMKNLVYGFIKKEHLQHFNIQGRYVGLAAGRLLTLSGFMAEHASSFVSVEKKKKQAKKFQEFAQFINRQVLPMVKLPPIDVVHDDIFTYLQNTGIKCDIVDVDLMCTLTDNIIARLKTGLLHATSDTATLALWHAVARGTSREKVDQYIRPMLQLVLDEDFIIHRHDQIDYFEGYPMSCEIFTLEHK